MNWDKEAKRLAIPAERKKQILKYIEENGSAQIRELSETFAVSEATVRRDLAELDDEGYIDRTHGGAILSGVNFAMEQIHSAKMSVQLEEKRAIAEYLASLIHDGDTLFLDAGSTTYQVGRAISAHKNLTIVTYDLYIASTISFHRSSTLIVTGGVKREGYNVLTGILADNFLKTIRLEKAILSADAVDLDYGPTNGNFVEASMKRMIVNTSKWVALAADHTKFGKNVLAKICEMKDIDLVVSDRGLERRFVNQMQENDVRYYLA